MSEPTPRIPPPISEQRAAQLAVLDDMAAELRRIIAAPPMPAYSAGRPVLGNDGLIAEDHSERLSAMDRLVKIEERRSRLMGLDAPERHAVEVAQAAPAPVSLEARAATVRRVLALATDRTPPAALAALEAELKCLEIGDEAAADHYHAQAMAVPYVTAPPAAPPAALPAAPSVPELEG